MRYTLFAIAALTLFSRGCSNDDRETSLLPEAQAAQKNQEDVRAYQ